jgi:large subunit ribosomal protein L35
MPKIKTNKSAAKRFKKTSSGKLIHEHSLHNHLMIHKGKGQSRRLTDQAVLHPTMVYRIKKLLPNGATK